MPRYVFTVPKADKPSGGMLVTLRFLDILARAGYKVGILHCFFGARPAQAQPSVEQLDDDRSVLRIQLATLRARKGRAFVIKGYLEIFQHLVRRPRSILGFGKSIVRSDDVIVAPEFWWRELRVAFPRNRMVLLAQGGDLLLTAWLSAVRSGTRTKDVVATVATSVRCQTTAEALGLEPVRHVSLSIDPEVFRFEAKKKQIIAYMPRKRSSDTAIVIELLRRRSKVKGIDFVPIHDVSHVEVAKHMREALFFLAMPWREGFGLPIAEAMASGCVVVGFTGQWADEFFDETTGIPVPEFELIRVVEAIEAAVAEYRADPRRLDALRRAASQTVRERYTPDAMRSDLLAAWCAIEEQLQSREAGVAV